MFSTNIWILSWKECRPLCLHVNYMDHMSSTFGNDTCWLHRTYEYDAICITVPQFGMVPSFTLGPISYYSFTANVQSALCPTHPFDPLMWHVCSLLYRTKSVNSCITFMLALRQLLHVNAIDPTFSHSDIHLLRLPHGNWSPDGFCASCCLLFIASRSGERMFVSSLRVVIPVHTCVATQHNYPIYPHPRLVDISTCVPDLCAVTIPHS